MNGWGLPNPDEPVRDFTLGERYGSNDMYRDLEMVSFVKDGQVYTDTVESVSYKSGDYIPAPPLSWWGRALRAVTPRRWRKPLPMGTFAPPTVTIQTGDKGPSKEVMERAQKNIAASLELAERLSKGI